MKAIISAPLSDSHTWNLVFLQLYLQERGIEVTNLGPCAPDELIISEANRICPDVVVISSVNGHGFNDGLHLADRFRQDTEVGHTPLVIGGKLGIAGADNDELIKPLMDAGFDAVFDDEAPLQSLDTYLARLVRVDTGAPRELVSSVVGGTS